MADNDDPIPETETAADGESRRRGRGARPASKPAAPDPKKLKFFTLIPDNPNIDFTGPRSLRRGLLLSLFMVLASFAVMAFNYVTTGSALNYGIDFNGGSSVRLALSHEADIEEIRTILEEEGYSGSSAVAVPDAENEVLIRVKETVAISEEELEACRVSLDGLSRDGAGAKLLEDGFKHPKESSKIFMKFSAQPVNAEIERLMTAAGCEGTASYGQGKPDTFPVEYALIGVGADIVKVLDLRLGAGTVDHIVVSETVGAKVGSQLKRDGVQAMLFAIGFIFLYVMIRFDLRFAPGGIVALTHDAIIVVGAFALTGKEFNLQTIAALLTIIGYSINDTIVVFDRIRERVALFRDDPIVQTTNTALNDTLSRTILTSSTTLMTVVATWVLGSGPIKDFAFALTVGLVVGTYSSLFVASPVFLWINEKMYKGKGHLLTADADAEEAKQRGTGTLLGGTGEPDGELGEGGEPPRGRQPQPDGDEPEDEPEFRTEAGSDESAGSDGIADELRITDVDKQASERKTRRRRRKPTAED